LFPHIPRQFGSSPATGAALPVAASAANLQQNIAAPGVEIKPARVTRRGSIRRPRNGTADSQLLHTQLSRLCQWQ
jgi:hypothetical protein